MSITNGETEGAEQTPQQTKAHLLERVEDAFLAVGYSYSDHAAHTEHEDVNIVPGGAVKAVEAPTLCTPTVPVRNNYEKYCPARLCNLLPPANYGAVYAGRIYRSAYPREENYTFLKSLKLKTILTLVPEECAPHYVKFMSENGIKHVQVHIPANKEEIRIKHSQMMVALNAVLNKSNWPILIHCNKGKHRTGCVVGCLRRVHGEDFERILGEYHTYAEAKARFLDEAYIKKFDEEVICTIARQNAEAIATPGETLSQSVVPLSMIPQIKPGQTPLVQSTVALV